VMFLGRLASHEHQNIPDIGDKRHGTESVI